VQSITIDGQPVEFIIETIGNDSYLAFTAPTGRHTIAVSKGARLEKAAEAPPSSSANLVDPAPDPPRVVDPAPAPLTEVNQEGNLTTPAAAGIQETIIPAEAQELAETPAARIARENRLALFQCFSFLLILFTSLGLIVVALLRRLAGLNQAQPAYYARPTANPPQNSQFRR
jgi:hypothetical protein